MGRRTIGYMDRLLGDEPPMIELINVSKAYQPGIDALKDVNITIEKGEFVFIVGHSGSGKSTIIRLLMKEISPSSGKIYVNNRDLSKIRHHQIPALRRKIGVVFQSFRLMKDRNIYDNVAFAQRVIEKSPKEIKKNVPDVLAIVGLEDKMDKFPKELSGGEQQRVAVARALVNQPNILLADEPTGNLDPQNSWEIMKLLNDINKRGTTVVVVTHNEDIVNIMQKRVITIEHGVVVSDVKKGGYSGED